MINENRLRKAMIYLAETDNGIALAKSYLEGLKEQRKTVKAKLYMESTHKSSKSREEDAYASQKYEEHLKKMQDAMYDYEVLKNKRLTEELIVEVWRSLNSARKKGNII